MNFSPSGFEHTTADSFNPLFLISREEEERRQKDNLRPS